MLKQRSEEWMRERADELKGKVRQMFGADRATSVAGMVILVDQLERLGLDNHFRDEINAALGRIHSEGLDDAGRSSNLHVVALRFCLLRQHGFWVSTGIDDRSSYIKLSSAKLINFLSYRLLLNLSVIDLVKANQSLKRQPAKPTYKLN